MLSAKHEFEFVKIFSISSFECIPGGLCSVYKRNVESKIDIVRISTVHCNNMEMNVLAILLLGLAINVSILIITFLMFDKFEIFIFSFHSLNRVCLLRHLFLNADLHHPNHRHKKTTFKTTDSPSLSLQTTP